MNVSRSEVIANIKLTTVLHPQSSTQSQKLHDATLGFWQAEDTFPAQMTTGRERYLGDVDNTRHGSSNL